MARRSSARLRERSATTPKRVSLSHDAVLQAPHTAPSKLHVVHESDEMPGSFPASPTTQPRSARISTPDDAATPTRHTPLKPSSREMHPKQHHQSTAKPMDEARHLGFSNVVPHTEPRKQASLLATLQRTPSKVSVTGSDLRSPQFKFTFQREHSLDLSPEAKRMMDEKRGEAARIREQMLASGESKALIAEAMGRKMATPVGKKGRFSDAHAAAFDKLPSIADRASAFRAKITGPRSNEASPRPLPSSSTGTKSLKRSSSKAELDRCNISTSTSNPAISIATALTPRVHDREDSRLVTPTSKRVKLAVADRSSPALSAARTTESVAKKTATTPLSVKFTTPTKISRSPAVAPRSVKATKIPEPCSITRKATATGTLPADNTPATPLLSRSPAKAALFPGKSVAAAAPDTIVRIDPFASPLLAKTPLKSSPRKKSTDANDEDGRDLVKAPLLSRSPLKIGTVKPQMDDVTSPSTKAVPFLARSPMKVVLNGIDVDDKSTACDLAKSRGLLRASPMKSILKTPRRLYSDDPAKVAAGTHLATPDKQILPLSTRHSKTAPVSKRVDFTSSTKGHELSIPTWSTVAKASHYEPLSAEYPVLPDYPDPSSPSPQKRRQTVTPGDFTFRVGNDKIVFGGPSPRATPLSKSPRAATIRHVSADSAFPPPAAGSKKRKFEFESEHAIEAAGVADDKENTPVDVEDADASERPTKRMKQSIEPIRSLKAGPTARTAQRTTSTSIVKRNPTIGVKPKGVKTNTTRDANKPHRPAAISQSRLTALSQPKRRV